MPHPHPHPAARILECPCILSCPHPFPSPDLQPPIAWRHGRAHRKPSMGHATNNARRDTEPCSCPNPCHFPFNQPPTTHTHTHTQSYWNWNCWLASLKPVNLRRARCLLLLACYVFPELMQGLKENSEAMWVYSLDSNVWIKFAFNLLQSFTFQLSFCVSLQIIMFQWVSYHYLCSCLACSLYVNVLLKNIISHYHWSLSLDH